MNSDRNIMELLVDKISDKLDDLNNQLIGYKPVLERVGLQSDEIIKTLSSIKNDISNVSKLLDNVTIDFYNRTDNISKNIDTILKNTDNFDSKISDTSTQIKDIKYILSNDKDGGIIKKIDCIKEHVELLGKFAAFISKPIGFLVVVITIILGSITINSCFNSIVDFFKSPQKSQQK